MKNSSRQQPKEPLKQGLFETYGPDPKNELNVSRYPFQYPHLLLEDRLSVSMERVELFQTIINSTNSPAKALQALFHSIMANAFYKDLPYNDVPSEHSASWELSVLQPVRKVGLIIILTALSPHIICVSIITFYFSGIFSARRPPLSSSINNVWQAHAQLMTPGIEEILRDPQTTRQSDREVKKRLLRDGGEGKGCINVHLVTGRRR